MHTHTHTPAGPPGSEMIQAVAPGAPDRNWSYGAAPGSRTYTNTNTKKIRLGDTRRTPQEVKL